MRAIPFEAQQQEVIDACKEAGVVLDFVRFDLDGSSSSSEQMHRRAAVGCIVHICESVAAQISEMKPAPPQSASAARHFRNLAQDAARMDPANIQGERVALSDFFGPAFDVVTRKVDGNELRVATSSFTDAFFRPPSPLGIRHGSAETFFDATLSKVLSHPNTSTVIHRWDGNWSVYFDAGSDAWASAVWTVARGEFEIVAVVATPND